MRKKEEEKRKIRQKERIQETLKRENHGYKETGITLVALVITTIFSYDENVKSSNNKGFLLQTI